LSVCNLICSNGKKEPNWGEECDDGNTSDDDGCSSDCIIEDNYYCIINGQGSDCYVKCGNVYENRAGEDCDDGNLDNDDGCDEDCNKEPLFNCENNDGQISVCTNSCGNGEYESSADEECDDGN
jgi:cysteine-rich repeat protein